MGSVRIVTRHEFRTAVTRPSYIILTAAVPVLVALAVAGFAIFTLVTREDAEADDRIQSTAASAADAKAGLRRPYGRSGAVWRTPGTAGRGVHTGVEP